MADEEQIFLSDVEGKARELMLEYKQKIRDGEVDTDDLAMHCAQAAIDHFDADSQGTLAEILGNSYELWWEDAEGENLFERTRWALFYRVRGEASDVLEAIEQEMLDEREAQAPSPG